MHRVVFMAAVVSSCLVAANASAEPDGSPPATGFTIEGRLSQSIAPVGLGLTAGTLLPTLLGGPPPASLGYRGDGWALTVGPSIGHIGFENVGTTDTSSIWYYGASVLGEVRLARTANRRTEGYLLLGANLAGASTSSSTGQGGGTVPAGSDQLSAHPAYGALAGFGLRHWLTPNLGIGAELGESYLNVPLGSISEDDGSTRESRMNLLSTFGDIHVALTL
jgi:hypothetical protein